MDEDLAIIAEEIPRREQIKSFIIKHKKKNLFFSNLA